MKRATIAIAALGVGALFAGRWGLTAYLVVVGVLAGGEVFRLVRAHGVIPSPLVGLGGIVAALLVAHVRGERAPNALPAVLAAALALAFVALMLRQARTESMRAVIYTVFPVILVGLLGSYVLALRAATNGFRLVAGLGVMVAGATAGAAIARSRRRGAHAQLVSQTQWQPVIGSLAGALLASTVVAIASGPPLGFDRSIVLGALVGLVVPLARFVVLLLEEELLTDEPSIRRRGPVVLPHLDGVLLAAPVFFYAYRVLAR